MTAPYGRPDALIQTDHGPTDEPPGTVDVAFQAGYQAALGDLATKILEDGERGGLQWLERNLDAVPARILVSARLIKLDNPFWDR